MEEQSCNPLFLPAILTAFNSDSSQNLKYENLQRICHVQIVPEDNTKVKREVVGIL